MRSMTFAGLLAAGLVTGSCGGGEPPEREEVAELAAAIPAAPASLASFPTGAMSTPRADHAAVLLHDGRVLVAGGSSSSNPSDLLSSAEIYDPQSRTWSFADGMGSPRTRFTATVLQSGDVLVVGGRTSTTNVLASARLYDPATDTWNDAGNLTPNIGRYGHAATLLEDGRVLVAGGGAPYPFEDYTDLVNVYQPGSGWSAGVDMPTPGEYLDAQRLPDGRVVVTGNYGNLGAIYDPVAVTWTAIPGQYQVGTETTITVLGSGEALFVGTAGAYLYDPVSHTAGPAGVLQQLRSRHTATRLADGRVLVAGGVDQTNIPLNRVDVYDRTTNGWSPAPPLAVARAGHTATLLLDGRVLLAGGASAAPSAELYGLGAAIGETCAGPDECVSGHCVDGVCCDAACEGECRACSVAAGAGTDGTCADLNGSTCEDGDACTTGDQCSSGACLPGAAVVCAPLDQCHLAGTCDPLTGCSHPARPDGEACDDGDACTATDSCQGGACAGVPEACPPGPCQVAGACDPASGACEYVELPDGTLCDDGSLCTASDVCIGGACVGQSEACEPGDACNLGGVCDPATGICGEPIPKLDGEPCPGGACVAGLCIPDPPEGQAGGPPGGDVPESPGDSSGCGCRVTAEPGWTGWGLLALGWLALRRRRDRERG